MSAKLTIISWRDIPAQVLVKKRRESFKVPLSPRFIEAIDRAAMRANKISTDAYLDDWQREQKPCSDDLEGEAKKAAEALEAQYSDEDLEKLVRAKGNKADIKG